MSRLMGEVNRTTDSQSRETQDELIFGKDGAQSTPDDLNFMYLNRQFLDEDELIANLSPDKWGMTEQGMVHADLPWIVWKPDDEGDQALSNLY
uniref:Uncharacterized protein n=1 Tax=Romanomermis culicivorax TaxID=13658 RepID=A0A915I889_ROMCU